MSRRYTDNRYSSERPTLSRHFDAGELALGLVRPLKTPLVSATRHAGGFLSKHYIAAITLMGAGAACAVVLGATSQADAARERQAENVMSLEPSEGEYPWGYMITVINLPPVENIDIYGRPTFKNTGQTEPVILSLNPKQGSGNPIRWVEQVPLQANSPAIAIVSNSHEFDFYENQIIEASKDNNANSDHKGVIYDGQYSGFLELYRNDTNITSIGMHAISQIDRMEAWHEEAIKYATRDNHTLEAANPRVYFWLPGNDPTKKNSTTGSTHRIDFSTANFSVSGNEAVSYMQGRLEQYRRISSTKDMMKISETLTGNRQSQTAAEPVSNENGIVVIESGPEPSGSG